MLILNMSICYSCTNSNQTCKNSYILQHSENTLCVFQVEEFTRVLCICFKTKDFNLLVKVLVQTTYNKSDINWPENLLLEAVTYRHLTYVIIKSGIHLYGDPGLLHVKQTILHLH